MQLLLDTHVWLWSLMAPARLSSRTRDRLVSPRSSLHLCSVSVWEVLVLAEKGRIALDGEPASWLREALAGSPVTETPLTFDVALVSRSIELPHGDPADRFIAASAKVFGLTLVTADRRLIGCRDIDVLEA